VRDYLLAQPPSRRRTPNATGPRCDDEQPTRRPRHRYHGPSASVRVSHPLKISSRNEHEGWSTESRKTARATPMLSHEPRSGRPCRRGGGDPIEAGSYNAEGACARSVKFRTPAQGGRATPWGSSSQGPTHGRGAGGARAALALAKSSRCSATRLSRQNPWVGIAARARLSIVGEAQRGAGGSGPPTRRDPEVVHRQTCRRQFGGSTGANFSRDSPGAVT
jgi:hypothetical protein